MSSDSLACLWSMNPSQQRLQVIDVGANPIEGDPDYKGLLDLGYCEVTGFEPNKAALQKLNAAKSRFETYYPYALGDGEVAELHLYKRSGYSSLFPICRPVADILGVGAATRLISTERLETRRLDDLEEVSAPDFLKIDVQGSELAVLSNARHKLAGCCALQVEVRFVQLYEGEPGFAEIDMELRAQGFVLHDFAFLKRKPISFLRDHVLKKRTGRQIIDGDAWYIRDFARFDQLSDEQLFKLALISDGIMADVNLAVACLQLLVDRGWITAAVFRDYLGTLPAEMLAPKPRPSDR